MNEADAPPLNKVKKMDMKIAMFGAIDHASQKMDAMMQNFGRNQINASRTQLQHHKESRQALAGEAIEIAALGYGFLNLWWPVISRRRWRASVKCHFLTKKTR